MQIIKMNLLIEAKMEHMRSNSQMKQTFFGKTFIRPVFDINLQKKR